MVSKKTSTSKKTAKKGPGRGWHGSSSEHAKAGRKGGFARAARWRKEHGITPAGVSDTLDAKNASKA